MKMRFTAPRKQAGKPHADLRDNCVRAEFVAEDDGDERFLASLYRIMCGTNRSAKIRLREFAEMESL